VVYCGDPVTHETFHHPVHRAWFCERCGSRLHWTEIEDRPRQQCKGCGHVVYIDPKVASGVIITWEGGVVLLRRAIEPGYGKWVFPGGYTDVGEPTTVAAAREAQEEVGLNVEVLDLVGVYSYRGERVVLVVYDGRVVAGEPRGNDETLDVKAFPVEEIPWDELAFPSTREALEAWMKKTGQRP
jgi:ADP-ribose pyrophosphatase YjhB (NUDIX family)